jgi:5'/3'-nucleotidase SurE
VKIAKGFVLNNKKRPDLLVSGINHGSNTSISVIYSGTMSAALEGAIEDIPSIGFSVCDYSLEPDFSHADEHILKIAKQVLKTGLPKGVALNVNFPAKREEPIKGIKICRQTRAKWLEEFDRRIDPNGREYFWLTGSFVNMDKGEDIDQWAVDGLSRHKYPEQRLGYLVAEAVFYIKIEGGSYVIECSPVTWNGIDRELFPVHKIRQNPQSGIPPKQ